MNDPAFIDTAKVLRRHLKEFGIVRQRMTGRGLKQRKCAREAQAEPGQGNQRPTIIDQHLQKSSRFSGHSLLRAVMPRQPLVS